ncbi:uncharacterized protein LOC111303156 [Durio zibethinus]|uniref:Uncharacterized protein LOC111303156 n=1 Tax=Durio zibethinus TaxID=66656 RepID=A0A6P5ZR92_DURZI|nr:uncharacterized protein LOC111303156 [Durio zibethinus]
MGQKTMYDTIFARSFSRYDQKKLGYGAFLGCLLIALSFCTVFKPYLGPLPVCKYPLIYSLSALIFPHSVQTKNALTPCIISTMLRITDSSSSLKRRANDTSSSIRMIVNETSSSEIEVVEANKTSSSNETILSNDAISSSIPLSVVNVTFSTNVTMRNGTISSNMSLPADDDDDRMSSSKSTPGINYTSSSSNVAMGNDTISSNMSVSVLSGGEQLKNRRLNLELVILTLIFYCPDVVQEKKKPICNVEARTEFCAMNGDIRIDGKSSTVYMAASPKTGILVENSSWIIRPYARKGDEEAMNSVTKWSVKSGVDAYTAAVPECEQNHRVPAIIFSLGGYAGNNFHDYTDIVIPLYLTSRQFDGEVKFLITNKNPWWINKFQNVLQQLSRYELIDIDREQHVHCFTGVIVGLKRNPKELSIDPSKSPYYSMKDFRQFLKSAYSLKKDTAIKIRDNGGKRRPRLLLLSRKRTRVFTNTNDIARMARRLGYKVVVAEADSNVARVAEIVNSCDVMMGVHGAGLTNMVFLPENAILIQIVPIGGFKWMARTDFEEPSKGMNLRYLEYEIKTEESTLIQQYPPEHVVLSNPYSIQKQGWNAFKSVYLQKQNVNLDINRFRPILLRAIELLHQ